MSHQTFETVEEMVGKLFGSDSFAQSVQQRLRQRQIVSALQAHRVARNIPRSRIAEELACSERRIAKIESSDDADLKLGELVAYARVVGCELNVELVPR